MSHDAVQIIARGPRALAESAAEALDAHPGLEAVTYSILEEDEDRDVWRIDAFPTEQAEADTLRQVLEGHGGLVVSTEVLADADWLAMALSGLPPVRAGRFFIYGAHDRGLAPPNAVNLRIGDRIDVNGNEDMGMGFIGNIAACLQFRRIGSVRAVDISIGGTGHDDFRTC